jgi:dimethylamine corrinoid protein
MFMEILEKVVESVMDGNVEECEKFVKEALQQGIDPMEIIKKGLSKAMNVIGEKFQRLEIFLPDMILAADAVVAGIEIIKPKLKAKNDWKGEEGKVVLGTIQGDVHDIGKNIVKIMLETSGFEVFDLGRDVPVDRFIEKAEELGADIIGMSALMTTTMVYMPVLIQKLKDMGIKNKYQVMVGGAPVLPAWADQIGAEGYGEDAMAAVEVAKRLIEDRKKKEIRHD